MVVSPGAAAWMPFGLPPMAKMKIYHTVCFFCSTLMIAPGVRNVLPCLAKIFVRRASTCQNFSPQPLNTFAHKMAKFLAKIFAAPKIFALQHYILINEKKPHTAPMQQRKKASHCTNAKKIHSSWSFKPQREKTKGQLCKTPEPIEQFAPKCHVGEACMCDRNSWTGRLEMLRTTC